MVEVVASSRLSVVMEMEVVVVVELDSVEEGSGSDKVVRVGSTISDVVVDDGSVTGVVVIVSLTSVVHVLFPQSFHWL
jgi:hypothetical protein